MAALRAGVKTIEHGSYLNEEAADAMLAAGCDILVSGTTYGRNSLEVRHLIDAGMTDLEAIEAATARGPETLGPQAPATGVLRAGSPTCGSPGPL